MAPDDHQDDQTRSLVALTEGVMVGHYRIIEKIGAARIGEVYLAQTGEPHSHWLSTFPKTS